MIKHITTISRAKITSYNFKSPRPMISPIFIQKSNIKRADLVKTRLSSEIISSINTSSYIIGKGIILFTMFYCSMNWIFYRGMRIDLEKEEERKNEKKDKK
jgi:hypothetical protein